MVKICHQKSEPSKKSLVIGYKCGEKKKLDDKKNLALV
jgi:hypothetical protein